jgi:hypothetical protein
MSMCMHTRISHLYSEVRKRILENPEMFKIVLVTQPFSKRILLGKCSPKTITQLFDYQ